MARRLHDDGGNYGETEIQPGQIDLLEGKT